MKDLRRCGLCHGATPEKDFRDGLCPECRGEAWTKAEPPEEAEPLQAAEAEVEEAELADGPKAPRPAFTFETLGGLAKWKQPAPADPASPAAAGASSPAKAQRQPEQLPLF